MVVVFCLTVLLHGSSVVQGGGRRVQLNTGAWMPLMNLGGTSQSTKPGNHFSNYSEFLFIGGRGIDTALTYTDALNAEIAAAIEAHPSIARSDLWVTTKVTCCPGTGFCDQAEYNVSIAKQMTENNALLRVEYTDITLLHHPCTTTAQTVERYLELEAGLKAGLTKAIGVSNFNADLLAALAADSRVTTVPAVNQCNHAVR